ncbi:MAG: glycosyltransferase [Ignavibacteria bacterium]|nr:glycosyltransferase [Ignavibacteria bacterium]
MSSSIKHITVLMSVYNDSEYLKYSVRSVLNQTYKDFEFLIIDDGSTDKTEDIIKSHKDSRIVYKKISHIGLAGALNFGLNNSSGDWIARIDADDLNTANRLKSQVSFINSNPSYNVISGWSVYFKDQHKILFELKTPSEDADVKKFLDLHNPINHSSVIFRKDIILDEGGYNEKFKCYEDFELWFRLRDKLKFKILPEILVYTRMRNDSMTNTGSNNKIYELLKTNGDLNLKAAQDERERYYRSNLLFWIEYFYGDKARARKYLGKDFSFKQAAAFLNTFLPEKAFDKILGIRLRYRLMSKFRDKKLYETELKKLISDKE